MSLAFLLMASSVLLVALCLVCYFIYLCEDCRTTEVAEEFGRKLAAIINNGIGKMERNILETRRRFGV
jgi:hypothetical protein